jgi:hypothetical protein
MDLKMASNWTLRVLSALLRLYLRELLIGAIVPFLVQTYAILVIIFHFIQYLKKYSFNNNSCKKFQFDQVLGLFK